MNAAMQYVVENFADCKKYCVGHSSGGQLIGYSSSAKDFDQLFLVASTNGYWKYLNTLYKLLMLLFWYIIVPLNVLINGYFNNKMYGVSGGFPKKIILELRHFCLSKQFFLPYLISLNLLQLHCGQLLFLLLVKTKSVLTCIYSFANSQFQGT